MQFTVFDNVSSALHKDTMQNSTHSPITYTMTTFLLKCVVTASEIFPFENR